MSHDPTRKLDGSTAGSADASAGNARPRPPYAAPRLVRYGSIVDLTGTQQAGRGTFDGQVVGMGMVFLKSF